MPDLTSDKRKRDWKDQSTPTAQPGQEGWSAAQHTTAHRAPGDTRTTLVVYGPQLSDRIPAESSSDSEISCTERCCRNRRATTLSANIDALKNHPLHPPDPEHCACSSLTQVWQIKLTWQQQQSQLLDFDHALVANAAAGTRSTRGSSNPITQEIRDKADLLAEQEREKATKDIYRSTVQRVFFRYSSCCRPHSSLLLNVY